MHDLKKHRHITFLFVALYVSYAFLRLALKDAAAEWQWLPLIPVLGMVACVIYMHRQQDEFIRRILQTAYVIAFWFTFLVLLMQTMIEPFSAWIHGYVPMWGLPLLGWLLGYVFSHFYYR